MATDWNQYAAPPQGFSGGERARVAKIKAALKRGAGGADKRLRKEMKGLYGKRKARIAPYDQGAYGDGTMTPRQIDQQVVSATRGKYGESIDTFDRQINATSARQAQIAKYYDDYNAELGAIRAQQAQQAQQMIDAQTANTSSTQKNEQAANQQSQTQMQADAASRGQSVDPSTFTKANQASAARATTGNSQSAALQQAKLAYDNFYGQQSLISRGARQGSLDREASHTNTLRDRLLGLKREAGDFATETRGKLDDANYNRALSAQALGVKAQTAKTSAKQAEERLRISQGNLDNATRRTDWATSPSNPDNQPKGAKPKFTGTQRRKAQSTYREVRGKADAATRTKGDNGQYILKRGQGQKFIDALVAKGEDPVLAKAAVMDALYGGVDAATRKAVYEAYGFYPRLSKGAKKKKK